MTGKRIYLQPKRMILNTILDIIELHKSEPDVCDISRGVIQYSVSMYGFKWELLYTAADIGNNRCGVTLEIAGDKKDKKWELTRQFALLDSMLAAWSPVKFTGKIDDG